jgi:integrase
VYAAWSRIRPLQVQARTWQSDQSAWTNHLATRFGPVPIGSITTLDVHAFAVELRAGHCVATVRRVIASLIAPLEFAIDHHYLEANPARIHLNLVRDPRPHHVTLEPVELVRVWVKQANHSPLADVTLFLGLTGLRWGEFIALRPCDIVTTAHGGPMAHITRSNVRARGEGPPTVKATKTDTHRLVPLPRIAASIANRWALGMDAEDLLVPGPDGGPLRPSTFRRQAHWTQTVPTGFRIHDLRHSAATNLLNNGADILGVQGILGHASRTTTLRYYGHLTGIEHLRAANGPLRGASGRLGPALRGRLGSEEHPRTQPGKPRRTGRNACNSNNFLLGPPRGTVTTLLPTPDALRDCTHPWNRLYDLLPINNFRDTERHPDTLSDREKGRRKGREFMRRFGGSSART